MEEIAVGQFDESERERIKRYWEARNAVFKRLEQIVDIAALSKEDREKYDESIRIYRDTLAVMECERDGMRARKRLCRRKGRRHQH